MGESLYGHNSEQREKSFWDSVRACLTILFLAMHWVLCFAVWRLHTKFYSKHIGRLIEFYLSGNHKHLLLSGVAVNILVFLFAMPIAALASHGLIWMVPKARRTQYPNTLANSLAAFVEVNTKLITRGGLLVVVSGLISIAISGSYELIR